MNLPAWLNNPALGLAVLSGTVGALWALSEIIGEFRAETGRALRTWGAWMLIIYLAGQREISGPVRFKLLCA